MISESNVYLSSPTNSTMFTKCCDVAICNDERKCPVCDNDVIGHEENSPHQRGIIRWQYAFKRNN